MNINSIVTELVDNQTQIENCTITELSQDSVTLQTNDWTISVFELEGSNIISINDEPHKFEDMVIDDEMLLLFEILENYGLDYELNY